MERFEYKVIMWGVKNTGDELVAVLNALGDQGWEVIGLAPTATTTPMPGVGVPAQSEVALLAKRPLPNAT